jgi:hypothetical protein
LSIGRNAGFAKTRRQEMKSTGKLRLVYWEKGRWKRKEIADPASFVPVVRFAKGVSRGEKPQRTEVWLAGGEEERSYIEKANGEWFFCPHFCPDRECQRFDISSIAEGLYLEGFARLITDLSSKVLSVPVDFKLGPVEEVRYEYGYEENEEFAPL